MVAGTVIVQWIAATFGLSVYSRDIAWSSSWVNLLSFSSSEMPYTNEFRVVQHAIPKFHKPSINWIVHCLSNSGSLWRARALIYSALAFPQRMLMRLLTAWSQPISCWFKNASKVAWAIAASSGGANSTKSKSCINEIKAKPAHLEWHAWSPLSWRGGRDLPQKCSIPFSSKVDHLSWTLRIIE